MINEMGLITIILAYLVLFVWAFRNLPRENWQFVASIPTQKSRKGSWIGTNLTFYGVFLAGGVAIAVGAGIVLMGSLGYPIGFTATLFAALLAACVPSAKWVAKAVEGKANTLTIGGAAFVGVLIAPWMIYFFNTLFRKQVGFEIPALPILAILAISYALGEGTGRLACISFGCCYGKPLRELSPVILKFFRRFSFSFTGSTKKVSYEGGLEATPVVPIQGISSVVLVSIGLLGILFFLKGRMAAAFLVTWLLTQAWRVVSEYLRADFRGNWKFSAYQVLALIGGVYGIFTLIFIPGYPESRPDLLAGLQAFWNPLVILAVQGVWLVIFLFTGRSKVTSSTVHFSVLKDKI